MCLCAAPALRAQESLTRIGPKTEVRSISFRFEDKSDLREDDLRTRISLTPQGRHGGTSAILRVSSVRAAGGHAPVRSARAPARHDSAAKPVPGGLDIPRPQVKYDVAYHSKHDVVDVTFIVRAGPPLMVDSLDFVGDSGSLDIPPEARDDWPEFVKRERKRPAGWARMSAGPGRQHLALVQRPRLSVRRGADHRGGGHRREYCRRDGSGSSRHPCAGENGRSQGNQDGPAASLCPPDAGLARALV